MLRDINILKLFTNLHAYVHLFEERVKDPLRLSEGSMMQRRLALIDPVGETETSSQSQQNKASGIQYIGKIKVGHCGQGPGQLPE